MCDMEQKHLKCRLVKLNMNTIFQFYPITFSQTLKVGKFNSMTSSNTVCDCPGFDLISDIGFPNVLLHDQYRCYYPQFLGEGKNVLTYGKKCYKVISDLERLCIQEYKT